MFTSISLSIFFFHKYNLAIYYLIIFKGASIGTSDSLLHASQAVVLIIKKAPCPSTRNITNNNEKLTLTKNQPS